MAAKGFGCRCNLLLPKKGQDIQVRLFEPPVIWARRILKCKVGLQGIVKPSP